MHLLKLDGVRSSNVHRERDATGVASFSDVARWQIYVDGNGHVFLLHFELVCQLVAKDFGGALGGPVDVGAGMVKIAACRPSATCLGVRRQNGGTSSDERGPRTAMNGTRAHVPITHGNRTMIRCTTADAINDAFPSSYVRVPWMHAKDAQLRATRNGLRRGHKHHRHAPRP